MQYNKVKANMAVEVRLTWGSDTPPFTLYQLLNLWQVYKSALRYVCSSIKCRKPGCIIHKSELINSGPCSILSSYLLHRPEAALGSYPCSL